MRLDPNRQRYTDFFEWSSGNLQTLFSVVPTPVNGLQVINRNEISTEFNYFGAVSRFYADAMLADLPDMPEPYADLLENMATHWAVAGETVLLAQPGGVRAIRPDYLFPVYDEYDKDTVRQYVFVFPQIKDDGSYSERARVITYDVETGQAYTATRSYRANWVDDFPVGEPIDISQVIWVNTNDGVYAQMAGIVREIIMRLNILQVALNAVAYPILQIDTDSISSGAFQTTGITQSGINTASRLGLGLTVPPPFIGEEGARYIERSGQGLTESMEYMRMLLGQLGVISGVPDYIFGVQLGRPANETERVLFSGQAKVNRFRRDVEKAFAMLGINVKFGTEPFVTRSERLDAVIKETVNGILTVNESRLALGYPPMRDGNRFSDAVRRVRETVGL